MGNFYTQILVNDSSQEECLRVMKELNRRSFIGPAYRGIVPVFDMKSEDQDLEELDSVAFTLSKTLNVDSVAILNHDDDILLFRIFDPTGFKGYCISGKFFGNPVNLLKKSLGANCGTWKIWKELASPSIFKISMHQRLVQLLDLPAWTCGLGYNYISDGDFEEELEDIGLNKI